MNNSSIGFAMKRAKEAGMVLKKQTMCNILLRVFNESVISLNLTNDLTFELRNPGQIMLTM